MVSFRDKVVLKNTNRKPYTIYRMVALSTTLSDRGVRVNPDFKVTPFSKSNIVKTLRGLKDKVTISH